MPAKPINYLGQSNLVTLLCCLPLGIVAIVYSSQVDTKYAKGDYDGAKAASANANKFGIISCVLGGVFVLFYVVMGAIGAAAKH